MSSSQPNYHFASIKPNVSSSLSDNVISDLKAFGLGDETIEEIKSLSVDLDEDVEDAGSLTDYVGGSPFVDIVRLSEIVKKYRPNSSDETFKDYCARVMEIIGPQRSSVLNIISANSAKVNEDDKYNRSLKNMLFACGFIAMPIEKKNAARAWVKECVEFVKKHPEYNKDGVFKWPESAVPCTFGLEESAARNFIGYIDTPRFKANVGFMRAMFARHKNLPSRSKLPIESSVPTPARSSK